MACSKIFSGDLPELINEVVQYFYHDYKTLHSCILVNRLWCRLAIPLLWEDPFSIPTENYHFIEIYLSNLNKDDKKKLNDYGINVKLFPSSTFFNYPSFIKCLNINNILLSIEKWVADGRTLIRNSIQISSFDNSLKLIYRSLFKMFIENIVNLHTFEIEMITDKLLEYFNDTIKLILKNPNFIRNIKILKFNATPFLKFINANCNSFYFQSPNDYNNILIEKYLSQIISSQQDLKKISFEYLLFNNLLLSLKDSNCSNTLKTIIFCEVNFKNIIILKEVFEQLNVLESVHILYCHSLNSNFIKQIVGINKPFKLKSLFIRFISRENFQINSISSLLQKSGNYLENIGFELTRDASDESIQQLFRLIKIYCTRIKFFKLYGFDNQNIYLIFNLIENIKQSLNYLSINFCKFFDYSTNQLSNDIELSSIVLLNLGQALPSKLEYLNLALKFNGSYLETFLENSQNTFIKKLLIRNKMQEDEEDILPFIKKYIMKEKRVKYLAIEEIFPGKRKNLFSSKHEVKEFELYNIEIQNYNELEFQDVDFVNEMC